ncbi:phosphate ABC transporter membrane protein 1, PhoT family [Frankineae bacterium MT45]|nr:phosphate ABC transporter membrane protein 1, PhoT family [Frankineae bacterium MT45]
MTTTDLPQLDPAVGDGPVGGALRADGTADAPRSIQARLAVSDRFFVHGSQAVGAFVLVIISSIAIFLGSQSYPTLHHYGLHFFTETRWLPNRDVLGIGSVLFGTLQVALFALVMSFPLALLTALFISDWAPPRLRDRLIRLVDLMAAVPSIIYGLWGLALIQPHATHIALWLSKYFGWTGIFRVHTDVNYPVWSSSPGFPSFEGSVFIASIAVCLMVFPMATSVMREVFSQAPVGEKEAAIALGATRWAMVRTVVIPFGRSGIIGGTMLALGRALGETISVVLIISQTFEFKFRPLESGTSTIASLIAEGYKEATPSQLSALLSAGFVLFLITLGVNTLAAMIVARGRSGAVTEL